MSKATITFEQLTGADFGDQFQGANYTLPGLESGLTKMRLRDEDGTVAKGENGTPLTSEFDAGEPLRLVFVDDESNRLVVTFTPDFEGIMKVTLIPSTEGMLVRINTV